MVKLPKLLPAEPSLVGQPAKLLAELPYEQCSLNSEDSVHMESTVESNGEAYSGSHRAHNHLPL